MDCEGSWNSSFAINFTFKDYHVIRDSLLQDYIKFWYIQFSSDSSFSSINQVD